MLPREKQRMCALGAEFLDHALDAAAERGEADPRFGEAELAVSAATMMSEASASRSRRPSPCR